MTTVNPIGVVNNVPQQPVKKSSQKASFKGSSRGTGESTSIGVTELLAATGAAAGVAGLIITLKKGKGAEVVENSTKAVEEAKKTAQEAIEKAKKIAQDEVAETKKEFDVFKKASNEKIEALEKQLANDIKVEATTRQYAEFSNIFDNPKFNALYFGEEKINDINFNVFTNQRNGNNDLTHFFKVDYQNNIVNYAIRNNTTGAVKIYTLEDIELLRKYAPYLSDIKAYICENQQLSQGVINGIRRIVNEDVSHTPESNANVLCEKMRKFLTTENMDGDARKNLNKKIDDFWEIIMPDSK